MYLVETQTFPSKITALEIKGAKPPPLSMHTMIHYEQAQYLIIYGGKTEFNSVVINKNIFVLSLLHLVWIKVR